MKSLGQYLPPGTPSPGEMMYATPYRSPGAGGSRGVPKRENASVDEVHVKGLK